MTRYKSSLWLGIMSGAVAAAFWIVWYAWTGHLPAATLPFYGKVEVSLPALFARAGDVLGATVIGVLIGRHWYPFLQRARALGRMGLALCCFVAVFNLILGITYDTALGTSTYCMAMIVFFSILPGLSSPWDVVTAFIAGFGLRHGFLAALFVLFLVTGASLLIPMIRRVVRRRRTRRVV